MDTPHNRPTRRQLLGAMLAAAAGACGRAQALSPDALSSLSATEKVMHDFVTGRMMDGDGLCRSFLCAATLAPWTNEDLAKTDQRLITDMFQNSPDKAGCLTYENALMATGEFALSQIIRHRVTRDAASRDSAQRAIRAILAVIGEGRQTDVRQMTHTRLPECIAEVSITSWLVAYWRLRQWAAR